LLRLTRPDGSFRTWWFSRPDESAMADPALELVLPEAAELSDVPMELLARGRLPELWASEAITVQQVLDYFAGGRVVHLVRQGYSEPLPVPRATEAVALRSVASAVEAGRLWLTSGPASLLGEPIPPGILGPQAVLHESPPSFGAAEILPENLPSAWSDGTATALSIATALSVKVSLTLPGRPYGTSSAPR